MKPPARVAVILVNVGDYVRRYLQECHASLSAQTYPAVLFTVFIVNNGVTEDSDRLAKRLAPNARFLHNPVNLGWAGGNNTAIKVALEEGFHYLMMLNMDTVVDRNWLKYLVEAADERKDVHIFQSTVLLYGTDKINSLGNRIHYLGYGYCNSYGKAHTQPQGPLRIDYASGAAMLVKREVFERIGLFREAYFMYYDDMEFCWRARIAGYNVGLAERSVCYHKYRSANAFKFLYYSQRNRLLTLLTLEKLGTILVTLPGLILAECVVSVYCVMRGWGRTQWDVCRYFFHTATWTTILATRREVKRLRRRKDADIVRAFAGQIHSAYIRHWFLRYVCNPLLGLYWAIIRTVIVW